MAILDTLKHEHTEDVDPTTFVLDRAVLSETADTHGSRSLRLQHSVSTVLVMILFFGSLSFSFSGCLPFACDVAFIVTAIAVSVLFQVIETRLRSRFAIRLVGAGLTAIVAILVALITPIRSAFCAFANEFISRYDNVFSAYVPLFPGVDFSGGMILFVLLGFLAAFIVWLLLSNRLIIVLSTAIFFLTAVACWLGTGNLEIGVPLGILAWLASWRLVLNNRFLALRSMFVAVCFSAVLVAISFVVSFPYQPISVISDVRDSIISSVDSVRYGDDTLAEGDLSKAHLMNEGNTSAIEVSYQGTRNGNLHLNGFVGANLVNGAWEPLDHTAYEGTWTGLYSWLGTQGFNPHNQRADFDDENARITNEAVTSLPISVKVTGADRKYVYAPTTLRGLSGVLGDTDLDGSLYSLGLFAPANYTMQVDETDANADTAITPSWLIAQSTGQSTPGEYAGSEAVYRSFVESHYLDLSDEDRALVDRLFYDSSTWNNDSPSTTVVVSRVRAMLTTLASYNEEPTPYSGGNFVSWFLESEHQGNSAYFSTAAVLAFRAQNVPARYVEGYLASDGTTTYRDDSDIEHLSLTSSDAHAWVEIYLDGLGWCPVEVTPGFYTQPYRADNVIAVNQEFSNNDMSQRDPAGALGGDLGSHDGEQDGQSSPLQTVISLLPWILLALLVAFVCLIVVLEVRRSRARSRLAQDCQSDDPSIAVPALFEALKLMSEASGVEFDEARPFEANDSFTNVFESVTNEEYERILKLMQKYAFGGKVLLPHEMHALRSFDGRIESLLKVPNGFGNHLSWRYRYYQ